ncbi:MAG TPA: hypothetical protein VK020_14785, partial [Microlunatus sp.]|nr:hypothetical protein [Microlunatus sp.]
DVLAQDLKSIHSDAADAVAELRAENEEHPERGRSVEAQIWATAEFACKMAEDRLFHKQADKRDVKKLRGYLVGVGCELVDHDDNPDTPPVPEEVRVPGNFGDPLVKRIQDQADAWQKVADATDADRDDSLYAPLRAMRTQLADGQERIEAVRDAIQRIRDQRPDEVEIDKRLPELEDLTEQLAELADSIKEFDDSYTEMGPAMKELVEYEENLPKLIRAGFKRASDDATKRLKAAIEPQIRKISEQAEVDAEAVGEMFEKSAAGLSNAAEAINRNGARIIDQQRRELRESEKRTAAAAAKDVDESLSVLARGVNNSTRDINASFALLEGSLKKVLLDLGDRKVNGSGLLGAMTTSAARVGTADFQLALASGQAESYAAVRGEDVNGILLRQAQLQAALQAAADLPAFQIEVPAGAESQTVYNFRIEAE